MPSTLAGQISAAVALLVCGYAILAGRRPEVVAAVTILIATAGAILFQDRLAWLDPGRRILALDSVIFVVLICMVMISQRKWLLLAAALQLLMVAVNFAMLYVHVWAFTFLTVESALTYGVLGALAWGTWQVQRASRLWRTEAQIEAARLVTLHGDDGAYEAALRLREQAGGSRRDVLDLVLMSLSGISSRAYPGYTEIRSGRRPP